MGHRTFDPSLRLGGDVSRVFLLVLLYTLQGVPIGLVFESLPYLLKKHASYSDLAFFSLSSYPYLFKLFWSPIVDSRYNLTMGRRRSWIVPSQIMIGVIMILLSPYLTIALESSEYLSLLVGVMFCLVFLAATQDIAVDAWALELLLPEHKSMGSVCQSVGQYLGMFISFPVMIAMTSSEFSVAYLGASGQILSINDFFHYFGCLMIFLTLFIQFCFTEDPPESTSSTTLKVILSQMFQVVQFSHMKDLIIMLLTVRLGFMSFGTVFLLQLSENGLNEMDIGTLNMVLIPVEIGVALVMGWLLSKHFSLAGFRLGFMIRVCANVFNFSLLYLLPQVSRLSWSWYSIVILGCLANSIGSNMMFSVITGLFFRISQKSLGGTYMTFLATVLNFGGMFPSTLALWSIDLLSSEGTCMDTGGVCGKECISGCIGKVNGFYPLAGLSTLFAILYYIFFLRRKTLQFDALQVEDWHYIEKKE